MNSITSTRCPDAFKQRRNILATKPARNAAQRSASLLNNNKKLALTLQETQSELSTYKKLFEESHEFMANVKLAKSRISAVLKEFVTVFDEALLLLEFDDSKWSDVKDSARACKKFQNKMDPIFDADQRQEANNPDQNGEVFQETESFTQNNKDFGPDLQTEGAKGNDIDSNVLENASSANLPLQTVKVTKIPKYQIASVNVKRQNFKDSKAKNKISKRKSPEKKCNNSKEDCRRKTFVIKTKSDFTDVESIDNVVQDVNGDKAQVPQDVLSIKSNKRKTFVKESSVKTGLCQNNEHQKEFAIVNLEVASIETKICNENVEAHSEAINELEKTTLPMHVCNENEENLAFHNEAEEISTNDRKEEKSELDGDNKTEEMLEHLQDDAESLKDEMNQGVILSESLVKSDIEFLNIIDMIVESCPDSTEKVCLESSESECELMPIEEISFKEAKCAFETTPIRRQISNNKRKKFVFGAAKRKSSLGKRKSFHKIVHSGNDSCPEKNGEICESDVVIIDEKECDVQDVVPDKPVNKYVVCSAISKTSKTSTRKSKVRNSCNTEEKKLKKEKLKSRKVKRNASKDDLIPVLKKTTKKCKDIYFDADVISECLEDDPFTGANITEEADKKTDLNLPCRKTGKNTFLVQAEIHSPPSSLSIGDLNKENEKLQTMQAAIVLDDVLKSRNIDFLNECDKDLVRRQSVSAKAPLSATSSNIPATGPEERLHSGAVLDAEKRIRRHRQAVCYKEPSCNKKLRR